MRWSEFLIAPFHPVFLPFRPDCALAGHLYIKWVARLTGLFDFQMKVQGKKQHALVEIVKPGIESWTWYNTCAENGECLRPGVSQNSIECQGWNAVQSCESRIRVRGQYAPVVIWKVLPLKDPAFHRTATGGNRASLLCN